jgi:FtsZ-binding cell division protein ZapB
MIACHVTRMMFTTATQCVNHRAKAKYKATLAASAYQEDPEFLAHIHTCAQQERTSLRQHKHDVIKQRNAMKQDLKMEVSKLTKSNRRLEHELNMARRKIEKMQRQMEQMASAHEETVGRLRSRLGEDDNSVAGDAPAVPEAEAVDWADLDHTGSTSDPDRVSTGAASSTAGKDRWAPVEFDAMAGLFNGMRPLPVLNSSDDRTRVDEKVPDEIIQAWYSLCIP